MQFSQIEQSKRNLKFSFSESEAGTKRTTMTLKTAMMMMTVMMKVVAALRRKRVLIPRLLLLLLLDQSRRHIW